MLLRFVIRNIRKRPFLNLIKVLGLALGLSGILFISLFLKNELSYDRFHANADRIYRFTITSPGFLNDSHFARFVNSQQIPDMAEHFPEIGNYVRLAPVRGGVLLHNERYYDINQAFICDSTFFDVFSSKLIVGNKETVLEAPGSMVITASFARKVFGNEDPVGEVMSVPAGQFYAGQTDYTIRGIMKDFPHNSHFHPELIATPASGTINWWAFSYLLLHENASPEKITDGYAAFLSEQSNTPIEEIETRAYLQNITNIHLHSDKLREIEPNGNMTNIYVLAVAAFILFLISVSNFTSLNLGMAGFYQKFISVNRILGSTKNTNLKYFAIESFLVITVSVLLSFLVSIPANSYIEKSLNINLFDQNTLFILAVIIIFCAAGFLAGLQPVLKQTIKRFYNRTIRIENKAVPVNKGIIITQYTLAILLIAAVIVISRQTNFVLKQSMGVENENIICFESVHADVQQKFELFKAELLKNNSIESVSAMMEPPGGEANDMFEYELEDAEPASDPAKNRIGVFPCDYSFASLFGLEFLSGKNFTEKNTDNEGTGEYIINETALHYLNHSNPDEIIGKTFQLKFNSPGIEIPRGKIIGVVKDFHLSTMKKKVDPLVMFKRDKLWLINFVVACKPEMYESALADIKKAWTDLFPAYPFRYEQVDSLYREVYKTELLQAKLLSIFTIISLFICSMGLLGISLLVSQQKVKEIGIRKVNGAKISEILTMLNKGFVKWVAIAFVIATPIAYYAMNKWLESFAYKTTLSWWIFALAGMLALGIALLTVSWQSWRAATRNPVEALRYE
ncbi:MAG: ABC transporter permease [Prolixibacteraceae bacterium]|nr:ABC transporter permease [Prolixibacteraceae bacterium]